MDPLRNFEHQQVKDTERPQLRAGDIVRVDMKITEGEKKRIQPFEGTVLGIRGTGPSVTFTVRREVGRFAVERIFPLYSPLITNIDILKRQRVRRAKLNYLREAGQRRVKEDTKSMQRHVLAEQDKKRLAEEAKKRAEDKARQAEIEAKQAEDAKKREEAAKAEAEAKAAEQPAVPPESPEPTPTPEGGKKENHS